MKARDIAQKVALLMTQSLCASSTLHSPHSLFSFSRSLHQHSRFLCTSKRSISNTMQNASDLDPIVQQKHALRSKVRKDLKAMIPEQRSEQGLSLSLSLSTLFMFWSISTMSNQWSINLRRFWSFHLQSWSELGSICPHLAKSEFKNCSFFISLWREWNVFDDLIA